VGFVPELGLRFPSAKAVAVRIPGGAPLSRRVHALTRGALTASPLVRVLLSGLASTTQSAAQSGMYDATNKRPVLRCSSRSVPREKT
jgi:hypothetical protein